MSEPDGYHPDHECENCGKTHMSYTGHIEFIERQKKTRNILIIIACISFISVPLGLTVFDYIKDPSMLDSNIDYSLFDIGYDLVCFSEHGMQYCIIHVLDSNRVAFNSERMVLQVLDQPCLNVNLSTPEKTRDVFLVVDGVDCIASLEFPRSNGWITSPISDNFYRSVKSDITYWWEDLNNELESANILRKL